MAWDNVYAGKYGWKGQVTLYQRGSVLDISSYTTKQFLLKQPDGTVITKTASFTTDGTDGKLEYTFLSSDITSSLAGDWKLQVRLAKTDVDIVSDIGTFSADEPLA